MRTKRKRACKKSPARKSAAVARNGKATNQSEKAVNQNKEAFLTSINKINKEDSVSADSNDLEVIDKCDSDPDDAKRNSSSSSSSSDSDESFSAEDSSSGDSQSIDRRSRKSTKGHGNGKQKASKLPKKGRKDDVKSSKLLRSSGKRQDEFKMPQQDPRYNKKELEAALEVIKKIMKMDEAQPFNVPVDPVASGKPDYYAVIDTPMDFGMICSNLESSIKYLNSEDVFNDVQYIWENCCKCNKKGEYIVYLMKRVKKKFMKYWTAAGLSIKQSRQINVGTSYKPSTTDYATRHSGLEPFYQVSSAVGGASQMQQDQLGFSQPYGYMPPFSYSQPHQLPQPTPSTSWPQFSHLPPVSYHQHCQSQHPQPSTNRSQFSQLQACTGCNNAGYSHLQPHKEIAPKHKKHEPSSKHKKNAAMAPAASICGGAPSDSHAQQPQLSNKQPYFLRQRQSISPLQPSQLHAAADGDIAPKHKKHASMSKHRKNSSMNPAASIHGGPPGHSQTQLQAVVNGVKLHLPPQADYTRSSDYVPLYPVDPMAVPGQSHPQQSLLSRSESSEPQQLHPKASHCRPQSSQLQDNLDIEYSHMSLTDSALRGIRCALEYSARPTTNKSNKANQDQLASVNLQPEQTPQSPEHPQRITKKKRGRGPTRCRFLNDLADGERIFVHFNKFGQPVGPESSKLSSFLGTIARNGHKAPLNFVHWRAMPDSYKEEMWEYTKFALDPSGKSWVMQSIATKWRNWKADLKATYYDSLKTDEERLNVRDPRVVPEQWPSLISYWSSDDTKKHCATNRANRLKQRSGHSSGTKSYARILEEERNKRPDGKEPTRAELYILTHTRKNGQPVDETAAELISKIREQEAKKETTSQCSDESNDTLCRVMGEENHNRVRTYRMRSTCTDLFGPISSRDDLVRMASEAKKSADEEVRKMVVKMEAMEEKYARMENHIARMTSSMEKFLKKVGGSSNTLGLEQAAEPEEDDA
ncbi:hypothetical protein CXB51_033635 [Gossypium anomalum]|uniref:Bromo domain-containing protein n=1 Tax=Gossypium anomalum TaxID=47600 RepID=A0A8J5YB18_9ROSI|nr:hypothetical protein CXB51_033635 [Gossypium anomalum]